MGQHKKLTSVARESEWGVSPARDLEDCKEGSGRPSHREGKGKGCPHTRGAGKGQGGSNTRIRAALRAALASPSGVVQGRVRAALIAFEGPA